MTKLVIIIVIIIVVIAIAALVFFFMMQGPDLKKYEVLIEPRITTIENKQMLEVTVAGEPDKVLKNAFGLLMQTYYRLKGVAKGPNQSAPILRCSLPESFTTGSSGSFGTLKDFTGKVAMSVPASVTTLPQIKVQPGLGIRLTTWEYGQVAEILHIGKYEDETATILKLTGFIDQQGYKVIGEHEEEYLRGPGMLFDNPKNYYTIIRYRIIAK